MRPASSRQAWIVVGVGWLGWGFDVFDALLFSFVAPTCVPTLLGLSLGTPAAAAATARWTGILTALLLVGWAVGGIVFGYYADRVGRARALRATILMFALATGACALAPSIAVLIACRVVASLGIGGEWAAGATLVAESVPASRRMLAGACLQTGSAFGLLLATAITWVVLGWWLPAAPAWSWRVVFGLGLLPVLVVAFARRYVHEPEGWQPAVTRVPVTAAIRQLFAPGLRARTLSGLAMAFAGLIGWWSCNAFLPTIASGLGREAAAAAGLAGPAATALAEGWKATSANWFNAGGVVGVLLTVPIGRRFGRRGLFALYYSVAALALWLTFGFAWPIEVRLRLVFLIGVAIFGVFGAFSFYLPELFPGESRALGAGFTYNIGRLAAAAGPFAVGAWSAVQVDPVQGAITALEWVALLPLAAALAAPFIVETGRPGRPSGAAAAS